MADGDMCSALATSGHLWYSGNGQICLQGTETYDFDFEFFHKSNSLVDLIDFLNILIIKEYRIKWDIQLEN